MGFIKLWSSFSAFDVKLLVLIYNYFYYKCKKMMFTKFVCLKLSLCVPLSTNRCAGAGHVRDDIFFYRKELEKHPNEDDENRSFLMDMGIKALRLVQLPYFKSSRRD